MCQTVRIQIKPTILPGLIWNQTVTKSADGKSVTSKERAGNESRFEKKTKIQIVAIYIVDVQTGINVINLLSCMLNSTDYRIYPAQNVKMQQLLAF